MVVLKYLKDVKKYFDADLVPVCPVNTHGGCSCLCVHSRRLSVVSAHPVVSRCDGGLGGVRPPTVTHVRRVVPSPPETITSVNICGNTSQLITAVLFCPARVATAHRGFQCQPVAGEMSLKRNTYSSQRISLAYKNDVNYLYRLFGIKHQTHG